MDDAYLNQLKLSVPGLKPDFAKKTTLYELEVSHNVDLLEVKPSTSDKSASYVVKNVTNKSFGNSLKLLEGENLIEIEVTSEDGTIMKYTIKCKRLSASDASLKSIHFLDNGVKLVPSFDPLSFEYLCYVDAQTKNVSFQVQVLDQSAAIEVLNLNTPLIKSSEESYSMGLNIGFTKLTVNVNSPDKSKSQKYSFYIIRAPCPRLCTYSTVSDQLKYEDSISLAPFYCSCISKNPVATFSLPWINFFLKGYEYDNLNYMSVLAKHPYHLIGNFSLEEKNSNSLIRVPLLNGEFSKESKLKEVSELIEEINSLDSSFEMNDESIVNFNPAEIKKVPDNLPSYQSKDWEKQLQIIYDETDPKKLIKQSQNFQEKYLASIVYVDSIEQIRKENTESALYFLNMSIFNLASSIKMKTSDYQIHFKLASLLEEKAFLEGLYGSEKEQDEIKPTLSMQNTIAADSSKEEEIDAICKSRNVSSSASDAEKLKALDQEYHYLLETGQTSKADYLQLLYQFKAKKITNTGGKTNVKLVDTGDLLVQANLKYIDGMALIVDSKQSNFHAYLTMGKSFCQIKDYEQASVYLKPCLNWSEKEMRTLARFYFAFSLSKQKELLATYSKQILCFLVNGLQAFLISLSKCFSNPSVLQSDDHYSLYNTIFLEAFIQVGKIKTEFEAKTKSISAENAFKHCAWLCCIALQELSKRTTVNRELVESSVLFKNLTDILIDAHYQLVKLPLKEKSTESKALRCKRCLNLLNLIRSAMTRENRPVLLIQEEIAELLAYSDPLDSLSLVLLAGSKVELYDLSNVNGKPSDSDPNKALLDEAKVALAVALDNLNSSADEKSFKILSEQKWWKKLDSIENPAPIRQPSASKIAPKVAVPTKSPAQAPKKDTKAPTKVPSKNINHSHASNSKQVTQAKGAPTQTSTPATGIEEKKTDTQSDATKKEEPVKPIKRIEYINKKVLEAQIKFYSGKVHSRLGEIDQAKSFYKGVITQEPKNQDAYVELANLLRFSGDLMGAVDVYANYPIEAEKKDDQGSNDGEEWLKKLTRRADKKLVENNSLFDDAFIYGEIVTLLMNNKNYDDPRLPKYLTLWAQIMGIAIIEKYITILDKANKTKVCKEVYANVHKKSVDDPDLAQFFKFKGWL